MDQCAAVASRDAAGERHWLLRGNESNQILEEEGLGTLSGVLRECQSSVAVGFPGAVMPSLTPPLSLGGISCISLSLLDRNLFLLRPHYPVMCCAGSKKKKKKTCIQSR